MRGLPPLLFFKVMKKVPALEKGYKPPYKLLLEKLTSSMSFKLRLFTSINKKSIDHEKKVVAVG